MGAGDSVSDLNIQLHGLEELTKEIERIADGEKITELALFSGAKYFKEVLEAEVYKHGLKKRSGKSEESFVIDTRIVDGTINIGISNQNNDAFYLYFHEWGTSKMPARPFMRPAFENHKNFIIQMMADEIRKWANL